MKDECCIVGAGPSPLYWRDGAYLIAADGGLAKLQAVGITPDLILGDFDSLDGRPSDVIAETLTFPIEKDDTDTMLAIKEALRRGYRRLYLSGGLGGRLDHTIANLQALGYAEAHGAEAYLVGEGQTVVLLTCGTARFHRRCRGIFSVFAFGDTAEDVTVSGAKYPADAITLTNRFPLGVSNAFTEEGETVLSVKQGTLLLVFTGTPDDVQFMTGRNP